MILSSLLCRLRATPRSSQRLRHTSKALRGPRCEQPGCGGRFPGKSKRRCQAAAGSTSRQGSLSELHPQAPSLDTSSKRSSSPPPCPASLQHILGWLTLVICLRKKVALDMKPYVLKNPSKTGRKNRNMYARLLLHMLKRGLLELPFTVKPGPGPLKTLPTYMSIYFEEPLSARSRDQDDTDLPDWVTGQLRDDSQDSLAAALLKDNVSSTPVVGHHRRKLFEESSPSKPSPIKSPPRSDARPADGGQPSDGALSDSDLEARLNSWNLGVCSSSYRKNSSTSADERCMQDMHTKEEKKVPALLTDVKLKVLEVRHQEERRKMQQRRDAAIEKILDRKNGEIEEIKSTYRAKQKESEEVIVKLEKKGERWRGPSLYMEDVYTVVSAHSALRGRFQRGPVGRDDLQLCGPKSQNPTFTVWFSSPCSFVTPPFCFCSPLEAISWEKCLCSDAPLSSVP
ncbi:unnamed protein product [Tetraodon nigroviridis]|uniref:(spotted green pufferfish) hypothetical protein n=1 Tax=Tetraodon nigroviridis TaxID=99883 RepID=Q4RJK6_TETNG|nr:unnamed protein product [Tetraodon nigroviridis]